MNATFLSLLAQAEKPSFIQQLMASPVMVIIPFFLLFYFMIIRPNQQQKKQHAKKIEELKKGDIVVTNGGIHGVVNHKSEKTCSLRVADGVFITMELANVTTVIPKGTAKPDTKIEEPA